MQVRITFPGEVTPPGKLYVGWRGLHAIEGGRQQPTGMPAVLPPVDTRALPMTEAIQRLSFELLQYFAPNATGQKWRAVHGADVAMTNMAENGYDEDRNGVIIPHADFINGRDLTAGLPRFDKMQRAFAGSFLTGEAVGGELWCRPGVDAVDATQPLPSVQTVVERNWYVTACTAGARVWNFPHLVPYPVVYLFIIDRPIRFPLIWFQRWERDYLPNHLLTYP